MKALVIIPNIKNNYSLGFSGALGWLFSKHIDNVYGIYGFQLNKEYVTSYNTFIIELNWYLQLYEFTLIVNFIKKHNKTAKILFGGLFASLVYKEIFSRYNVDYYIKGDNETPMRMFLDDIPPWKIPNFLGRNFENETSYVFQDEDFKELEFSLEWFPDFYRYMKIYPPENNSSYMYPMVFTSKGGCTAAHEGCEYCMGSHHDVMKILYRRKPLIMDNDTLITILRKLDRNFQHYSLFIISKYNYDFSGEEFYMPAYIEVDSSITPDEIRNIFNAFRICELKVPLYSEGVMGKTVINTREVLLLEDENHKISFLSYPDYKKMFEDTFSKDEAAILEQAFLPYYASWDYYTNFNLTVKNSKIAYDFSREKGYLCFNQDL